MKSKYQIHFRRKNSAAFLQIAESSPANIHGTKKIKSKFDRIIFTNTIQYVQAADIYYSLKQEITYTLGDQNGRNDNK